MHNPKGAWRMCIGPCILQLCIVGLSINSFSVYLPYLLDRCGLTNTQSANILLVLGAVCCFALIRNWPEDVEHRRIIKKQRKKTFRFRWMYVAAICVGVNGSTSFQFIAMHFTNQGLSAYQVVAIVSAVSTALMISKFLFGGAVDHFGTQRTNRVFMLVSVVGLSMCCASGNNYVLGMIAMILYGLGLAYSTIGLTVYAEDFSGVEEFEDRVREYQICYLLGSLISSPVPGIIADTTGSYIPFYAIAAVLGLVALLIIEHNYKLKKVLLKQYLFSASFGRRECQSDIQPCR